MARPWWKAPTDCPDTGGTALRALEWFGETERERAVAVALEFLQQFDCHTTVYELRHALGERFPGPLPAEVCR